MKHLEPNVFSVFMIVHVTCNNVYLTTSVIPLFFDFNARSCCVFLSICIVLLKVFRGKCLGQAVAVKTMLEVTEDNVRAFRDEILLTATLRHPVSPL
jgi:hypothetical protein